MAKIKIIHSEEVNNFFIIYDALIRDDELVSIEDLKKSFKKIKDSDLPMVYNNFNHLENSLLSEASSAGKEKLAMTLVELGFDINSYNVNGNSILINAVKNNMTNLVDMLLERNVDINYARLKGHNSGAKVGSSALMYACDLGYPEIVRKLLNHGADPNYSNDLKQTAILYTVKNSPAHFECFKILSQHPGVKKEVYDCAGNNIFERVINFCDEDFLLYVLDNGLYNQKTYDYLLKKIEESPSFWPKLQYSGINEKNTLEIVKKRLELVEKYHQAELLNNELPKRTHDIKKFKI